MYPIVKVGGLSKTVDPNVGSPNGYIESLCFDHHVYVEILILRTSDSARLADASRRLISGQVDMDATAQVTRSGKVQLWDPSNDLGISLGSQAQYDRTIQVNYWVRRMGYTNWHRTAIATCIITEAARDGGILNLEFKGKEVLADHGLHTPWVWPAGWAKSSVIMNAMTVFTGEWAFWDYSGGLAWNMLRQNWSLDAGENLWAKLKELATSMGCTIHYNGEGILVIRQKTTQPVWTISSPHLTSEPTMEYDFDDLVNMVRVEGAMMPTWDGGEVRLVYDAWPNVYHPFSPWMLARNGVPRVLPKIISDDQITDVNTAAEIAWSELSLALVQTNTASATTKILPFLEEHDCVTIVHPKLHVTTFLNKWSIPLVGDGEQSMNFLSNTSFAYTGGIAGGGIAKTNAALIGSRPKAKMNSMGAPIKPHGASGAFNTVGGRNIDKMKGENWYGGKGAGGKDKDKKGNKDKNKGKNKGRK